MKKYFAFALIALLFAQVVFAQVETLDYFTFVQSGLTVEFTFYSEPEHVNEIGKLAVMRNCQDGISLVSYSGENEESLISFAQNVDYSWNSDFELREMAWSEGYPVDWLNNSEALELAKDNLFSGNVFCSYNPIVVQN